MKCTICDKCKKIIERPGQVRTVTCTRPMKNHSHDDKDDRWHTIDKQTNDVVWARELCMDCAAAAEAFLEPVDGETIPDDGEEETEPMPEE